MGNNFYVIGRVQSHPPVLSSLTPTLLVLVLQFFKNVSYRHDIIKYFYLIFIYNFVSITCFETQFIIFCTFVVIQGFDGNPGFAVVYQGIVFFPVLFLKWIGLICLVSWSIPKDARKNKIILSNFNF